MAEALPRVCAVDRGCLVELLWETDQRREKEQGPESDSSPDLEHRDRPKRELRTANPVAWLLPKLDQDHVQNAKVAVDHKLPDQRRHDIGCQSGNVQK